MEPFALQNTIEYKLRNVKCIIRKYNNRKHSGLKCGNIKIYLIEMKEMF